MPKLPRITARDIIAVLERAGFTLARQSGSHKIYKNAAGRSSGCSPPDSRRYKPLC